MSSFGSTRALTCTFPSSWEIPARATGGPGYRPVPWYPVPAAAQGKTIAIAAGQWFNAALLYDGTILTWGTADTTQTIPPPTDGTVTTALATGDRHLLTVRR